MIVLLDGKMAFQYQSEDFKDVTQLYLGHAEDNQGYLLFFFNCRDRKLGDDRSKVEPLFGIQMPIIVVVTISVLIILPIITIFFFFVRRWVLMRVQDFEIDMPTSLKKKSSRESNTKRDVPLMPSTPETLDGISNYQFSFSENPFYEKIDGIVTENRLYNLLSNLRRYFPQEK